MAKRKNILIADRLLDIFELPERLIDSRAVFAAEDGGHIYLASVQPIEILKIQMTVSGPMLTTSFIPIFSR